MEDKLIKTTLVTAIFDEHANADRAINALREQGIKDEQISIIGRHSESDSIATGDIGDDDVADNRHVARGAIGGGALGAGLAVAAVLIPGLGTIAAGGVLAAALTTGVTVGAGIGGLAEALRDAGMNEADAKYAETRLGEGAILIGVDPNDAPISSQEIDRILMMNGGHRQASTSTASAIGDDTLSGAEGSMGAGTEQRIPAGTTSL